jgi:CBS domain-containing protein
VDEGNCFRRVGGAVSIALVLSLPETPFRNEIVAMTFGVALLSLVVQAEIMQVHLKNTKNTLVIKGEQALEKRDGAQGKDLMTENIISFDEEDNVTEAAKLARA